MEQRHDEFALHALAEGKLADRRIQHMLDPEELRERSKRFVPLRARDLVEIAVQDESIGGREIPDELRFLTHHKCDLLAEIALSLIRRESEDATAARAGRKNAREHFERRGLAGTIGSEKTDETAFRDAETDVIYSVHVGPFSPNDTAESSEEAGWLLVVTERAPQVLDDNSVGHRVSGGSGGVRAKEEF